jgi:uncharacterized protein YndB with AHSA1/START domain
MTTTATSTNPLHRQIVLTRIIDAPRDLVFRMWTEREHLARWWGPKGFTNPVCEVDARPGGGMRIVMRAPDGAEHPMTAIFHEVVAPERLVFTAAALDPRGNRLLDCVNTVTFAVEPGNKTRLTLHASAVGLVAAAAAMLEGMAQGWSQSLDRLADLAAATR